jgi:hypothetical protein
MLNVIKCKMHRQNVTTLKTEYVSPKPLCLPASPNPGQERRHKDACCLGCSAVQPDRCLPMFGKCFLHPSTMLQIQIVHTAEISILLHILIHCTVSDF